MANRAQLTTLVKLFSLLGLIAITIPFIQSLMPTPKAVAELPHIHVGDMTACSYLLHDTRRKGPIGSAWLIIKDRNSAFHVFTLPTDEGKVLLPDLQWFRFAGSCAQFRPELEQGRLKPGGVIRCHDPQYTTDSAWRWTYQGKSLVEGTPDLPKQRFGVEGDYLIIGKRD
ncbi:MAG: hypothetical protein OEZ39_00525 [Gammaproteobacteria bacterium]|nr:hypothetical protein [Gammaproteobacteria bacterium]MDH5650333.1 hypothetical protein [Gammaproteobacteria bacterium]